VCRFAVSAAWAIAEQCKLLSGCGVSFQLFFQHMVFRARLLQITFRRNQHSQHDYIALSDRSRFYHHEKLSLCFFIFSYCLTRRVVSFLIILLTPVLPRRNTIRRKAKVVRLRTFAHADEGRAVKGGHGTKKFSTAEFLSDFVEPHGQQVQSGETYHYIDHTDDVGLLSYSKDTHVFASIPLGDLLTQVTVSQGRALLKRHNVSWGTREGISVVRSRLEHHSGLCCTHNISVFIKRIVKLEKPKSLHAEKQDSIEFPPTPLDTTLTKEIIEKACNRMKAETIGEKGCAVCGELKPVRDMSRLKSVKHQLHSLATPGATRVERNSSSVPLREYKGPVLDYNCTMICNSCRGSIRNGKIPKLALANGLWIGDVPPQLKCLNFVEKMLVARIRHTCAYVKVASGMRKMTANVVAFQSPVPKVYTMLPPPRDDLDEVLAILYTGPCKPTPEDLKRLPFFVRRNKVVSALEWLILNHRDYSDVKISQENLEQYSETEIPVSIEYRECSSNKIPEGTSKYDLEAEHGVMEGECSFSVHGLTGESIEMMSSEALKAAALKHLNIGGSMLAVGHASNPESIYNNPQLYPQMFPWLFPYGLGGIGSTSLSDKEHKRHLLMYHDKRFQTDINFPFVAFSHEQVKTASTQSYLLVDQARFANISQRLLNLDQAVLSNIIEKMQNGEHIKPTTESEKACFQVLHDLDHVSGKVKGSVTSKKYMRNEIWSLIAAKGAPIWYITLSPADIQHPISLYYADTKEEFKPEILLPYDERHRLICKNPVAGARFFHFMVETFISEVLGVGSTHRGLYGDTNAYYGTVEQQGRLTLHLHMLLWIKGGLRPEEIRKRLLDPNSDFRKKMINWLESVHTGDFQTGSFDEVAERVTRKCKDKSYKDPTQVLPKAPQDNLDDSCWNKHFKEDVDELVLKSNVHNCEKYTTKSGRKRKDKDSYGCRNNKWGKCKARFPRPLFEETTVDPDSGAINMKKSEPWINTITPVVTYIFRCNTDITCLLSGTAIKAVVMYVSDYITKTSLKTHTIFDSIRSVFHKNSEMIGGTLPMKEKARMIVTKIVNLISSKMEMGAPMISMYLLGNPDHYTDHKFVPFFWQSYVTEAEREFRNDLDPMKVTLVKKKGRIIGISPVFDYIYRPLEFDHMSLYDWVRRCSRVKLPKVKISKQSKKDDNDPDVSLNSADISFDSVSGSLSDSPESGTKRSRKIYSFLSDHPLHDTHGLQLHKEDPKKIPNFIGATLPRKDQGDRNYYCLTMLALFKPWRKGSDLKSNISISWHEAFEHHSFSEEHISLIQNFHIKYECLDARDDYRAQLSKEGPGMFLSSWDNEEGGEYDTEPTAIPEAACFDQGDTPSFLQEGSSYRKRKEQRLTMRRLLASVGWTKENKESQTSVTDSITPLKMRSSADWKAETSKYRQLLLDQRKESNDLNSSAKGTEACNIVKVVDKSYLQKAYHAGDSHIFIEQSIKKYTLNREQERAFRIIANHASGHRSQQAQLKMYIGGMGGTGKSQVLKALSYFFELRKETNRFVIVAPTGTAASLLGGSTYHSMFGINEHSGTLSNFAKVLSRLSSVDYVFFDEVSMLSARDLYRISYQLAHTFNKPEAPFGGMNMVFCGDFAQLPPVPGGESKSLYSRTIGALGTSLASQEEAIGKALWHQITTVVILRQNMRQRTQSKQDGQLRTALENMRYKSCTPADIDFLYSRVSSTLPGRVSVTDENFKGIPIITALNIHKDEINAIGAERFARETEQDLIDFYSDDSVGSRKCQRNHLTAQKASKKFVRLDNISNELQDHLWGQLPSDNSMKIAGKLPICLGMPVMIRNNFATELCITRGQEGYVCGWQSTLGTKNQRVLDTLFVKLKDPPKAIKFDDLPENVVPIPKTSTSIEVTLPNDTKIRIVRSQVEVSLNFSMTDYASQGKTRPYNVVDLNNLRTHQAYYTALSRSSSADGTLILQGFDPSKITGKISGALRQEFRELELLDDITDKHYKGKTALLLGDDNRNYLIKAYREAQGLLYVPPSAHKAIRWSAKDPLLEPEIHNFGWHIARSAGEKEQVADGDSIQEEVRNSDNPRTQKRVHDEIMTPEKQKSTAGKVKSPPHKIKKGHNDNDTHEQPCNHVPEGFEWSDNSCAYDSVLTILFAIWSSDNPRHEAYSGMTSNAARALQHTFENITDDQEFEKHRDTFRHALETIDPQSHRFGEITSVGSLLHHLLATGHETTRIQNRCSYNHTEPVHSISSGHFQPGLEVHRSIQHWVNLPSISTRRRCRVCSDPFAQIVDYVDLPSIIAFELKDKSTILDSFISLKVLTGGVLKYRLAGIVYFGDVHFVARVLRRDGQIWFHDGITTRRNLIYEGTIASGRIDLSSAQSKAAHTGIYCRI